MFCFVCFTLKPASSCNNTTGQAARRENSRKMGESHARAANGQKVH